MDLLKTQKSPGRAEMPWQQSVPPLQGSDCLCPIPALKPGDILCCPCGACVESFSPGSPRLLSFTSPRLKGDLCLLFRAPVEALSEPFSSAHLETCFHLSWGFCVLRAKACLILTLKVLLGLKAVSLFCAECGRDCRQRWWMEEYPS
jgi:hypothetical protein